MKSTEVEFTGLPDRLGQEHAIVLETTVIEGEAVTTVVLSGAPGTPIVPASLWDFSQEPRTAVIELHKLEVEREGTLTFRTFEFSGSLPVVGGEYSYQLWFSPDQLAVVTDLDRRWEMKDYPDNGSHDHCRLTWETISANVGEPKGYESDGDWITIDAYNKYIVNDFLRVRGGSGS